MIIYVRAEPCEKSKTYGSHGLNHVAHTDHPGQDDRTTQKHDYHQCPMEAGTLSVNWEDTQAR